MTRRRRVVRAIAIMVAAVVGAGAVYSWLGTVDRGTAFAVHTKTPIRPGENLAWCATSQLAWDSLADAVGTGGRLDLGSPAPPGDVGELNLRAFPHGAIDPASFVAMGGLGKDELVEKIRAALVERFGDRAPRLDLRADPNDAVAYAYLSKRLAFAIPFSRLDEPIRFRRGFLPWMRGKEVAAFGVTAEHDGIPDGGTISSQVTVLQQSGDPNAPAEFVLRVACKDPNELMILARVDSDDTLEETWLDVQQRMVGNVDHRLASTDFRRLAVPMIALDEARRFADFVGAPLLGVPGVQVRDFTERVGLRLDETGLSLDADSTLRMKGGGPPPPRPDYVFDRPFLLALIRRDAMRPYFLLWVGNDGLFVPFGAKG